MPNPFLGEIKIVAFNFAPRGWAQCNGQLLTINQNQALYSLIGTTYGGNGQTTFALPNLQARLPMHIGGGHSLGEVGGESAHTLTLQELPTHVHMLQAATSPADQASPAGALLAPVAVEFGSAYAQSSNLVAMAPGAVTNAGGSQPHENLHPTLDLMFVIALQGVYPSRN